VIPGGSVAVEPGAAVLRVVLIRGNELLRAERNVAVQEAGRGFDESGL
jgi:hypothetical protein